MRNPLNRRFGRQLVHNACRCLGIFALLAATISVVSGCLATISSVQKILDGMYEKNSIEDARFETAEPIGDDARDAVEETGAMVFDISLLDQHRRNDVPPPPQDECRQTSTPKKRGRMLDIMLHEMEGLSPEEKRGPIDATKAAAARRLAHAAGDAAPEACPWCGSSSIRKGHVLMFTKK
jgi:hypothetical protein